MPSIQQAVRARWSRIVHRPPSFPLRDSVGDLDGSRAVCPVSQLPRWNRAANPIYAP
ncbi:protein of unknown function [Nitrospira defluvii]|uniref:Uncharacterized protein n=1 Tax=Nitrospira defluvii TaxID=330214 RepID=D8P9M6_9BACT|nr:protein of unknown function [Nitrospira defluvii]